MQYDIFPSPVGKLTISTDGSFITGLHIEGDRYFTEVPKDWKHNRNHSLLHQAHMELEEYFAGWRTQFGVPLKASGTDFQKKVWLVLRQIAPGTTATYSELATRIGSPKAVRAVGTAVGRNPICIIVPCHRVRASNGGLGGFVAGIERKQLLLDAEAENAPSSS